MIAQLLQENDLLLNSRLDFSFVDDFDWYISPHRWTSLAADANTAVSVGSGAGGILTLNTGDATDNNEAGFFSTNAIFLWANAKPIYAEVDLKHTAVGSNTENVAFGFSDSAGANMLLDDGAGPSVSNCGAMIYKVDGGTVWRAYSKNGSTTTDSVSEQTAAASAYHTLKIAMLSEGIGSGNIVITYFLDGHPLTDSVYHKAIVHYVPYASAVAMKLGAYGKVGSAAAFASLKVDRIGYDARR